MRGRMLGLNIDAAGGGVRYSNISTNYLIAPGLSGI